MNKIRLYAIQSEIISIRKVEAERIMMWHRWKQNNNVCLNICSNAAQLQEVLCLCPIHSDSNNKHNNDVIYLQYSTTDNLAERRISWPPLNTSCLNACIERLVSGAVRGLRNILSHAIGWMKSLFQDQPQTENTTLERRFVTCLITLVLQFLLARVKAISSYAVTEFVS